MHKDLKRDAFAAADDMREVSFEVSNLSYGILIEGVMIKEDSQGVNPTRLPLNRMTLYPTLLTITNLVEAIAQFGN